MIGEALWRTRPLKGCRATEVRNRIPLQLTRPGQLNNGCKITFQSSSHPRISSQEALISTH
ncbi:unnamed protein product [Nezara viridula]|uniref:Uncharacterized protein n=1 Tax=Nezara viridula TaxID=85310 RepID=A0A9P0H0Y4_NEZVI|nr:unnamed protein product [Nezara viridula]